MVSLHFSPAARPMGGQVVQAFGLMAMLLKSKLHRRLTMPTLAGSFDFLLVFHSNRSYSYAFRSKTAHKTEIPALVSGMLVKNAG